MKQSSKYGIKARSRGARQAGENEVVNSLSRGLQILECFALRTPRLSQVNLQKLTDIPKSTLFRLLRTLARLHYLKYDAETRRYSLGPKVLTLGFSLLQNLEAREIARPYLDSLSKELNRGVSLLMLDDNEMVYVERIRVPILRDFNIGIGSRVPIYNTASGKAVLAYLPQVRVDQIINELKKDRRLIPYIGKNGEKIGRSLVEVRRQGYAINDQESLRGVRAIAVPIFSASGLEYAINVVVPPEEVSVKELRLSYAPRLIAAGRELSAAMGYREK